MKRKNVSLFFEIIYFRVNISKLEKMIGYSDYLGGVLDLVKQQLRAKYEAATVELTPKNVTC